MYLCSVTRSNLILWYISPLDIYNVIVSRIIFLNTIQYTYIRQCRKMDDGSGKATWVILARSHQVKSIPATSKAIRVDDYKQFLIIQEDDEKRTKGKNYFGYVWPVTCVLWEVSKYTVLFLFQRLCITMTTQVVPFQVG